MKPTITWVLLANAGIARVVENRGPGKGFVALPGMTWRADDPVEYADKPGVDRGGYAHTSTTLRSGDPKDAAETAFAIQLSNILEVSCGEKQFDRLIVSAAPHLLGKLRAALPEVVQAKVLVEVDKDLTHIQVSDLADHLVEVIAA